MRRLLIATCFTGFALASAGAAAFDWPWEEQTIERPGYCAGFVVGGLASYQPEGVDRTQLWLAWNYLVRDGAVGQAGRSQDYPAGVNRFATVSDAGAAHALVTSEYGDCGLGRTGYAVTGW